MKDMAIAFLEERDLTAADLPTFLLIHTALSAVWVSSTWYWCYQNPRSSHTFLSRRVKNLTGASKNSSTPGRVQKLLQTTVPSLDATKLATSFVEAKIGRLVVKPVTIPARLWMSWKGTLAWKQQELQRRIIMGGKSTATTAPVKVPTVTRRGQRTRSK